MASFPPSLADMSFDNTLGALYIGNACALVLFGVTSFQVATFFGHVSKDRTTLRSLVALLWVLDLLHSIFNSHAFYFYAVKNYTKPLALLGITWSIVAEMVTTVASDGVVKGVFIYRIWRLSNRNIPLVIVTTILASFVTVTGLMLAAKCVQTPFWLAASKYTSVLLYSSLAGAVVSDTTITVILCILLSMRHSIFKKTQSMIKIVMAYTINAGVLISVAAIASLIAYATMSTNFIFLGIYSVLPKLYLNSLLATLNAQWLFQHQASDDDHLSIPLSKISPAHIALNPESTISQPPMSVQIDKVTEKFNPSYVDIQAE